MTNTYSIIDPFEFGMFLTKIKIGQTVIDRSLEILTTNMMEFTDCGFENLTAIYFPNNTADFVSEQTDFPWCVKNGQIYNQLHFICKDRIINCAGNNA